VRFLVAEDEPEIADFLDGGSRPRVTRSGVAAGEHGEAIALREDVALVVLDVMLTGEDGLSPRGAWALAALRPCAKM
jgi:DNA-binding response OmpR family regulator